MPVNYTYQDSAVVNKIAPDLIQSQLLADPIFEWFPIRDLNAAKLRWTIKDNYRGLMNLRGLNGAPTRVLRPGESLYEELPGVYGEFTELDEMELTQRAANFPATMTIPVDVADLTREGQMVLTIRQTQRIRQTTWILATTHSLAVPLPNGGIGHLATFAGQSMTVATLWSNLTASTPLHDLRQLQFLYGRGTSNNYGSQAVALMNGRTAGYIMDNRNAADVGGIRAQFGMTAFNSIEDFNKMLLMQGAPRIQIFEDSYRDETNTYQMYLPDGVVLVIAARPGNEKPGAFMYTRHMVNGGGTQPYAFINDYTKDTQGRSEVPPRIEIHQGFNGGPVQERPSQTVTLTVA